MSQDPGGTPLPRKLGIAPGDRVAAIGTPPDGLAGRLGDVAVSMRLGARVDVIVLFARDRRELARRLDRAVAALEPGGGLWLAWPKRSSGVASDLDDATVRELGLARGLVDNKVCAIDETWSGLRFVNRRR